MRAGHWMRAVAAFGWWCVVLLKRHSSIVRRPGRTCKHVRSPNSLPAISDEVKGSHAIAHATTWGTPTNQSP